MTKKEEIMLKLILGMGRANETLYLNYQHHMIKIAEAIEQEDLTYAEALTDAICKEIDKRG
jgi:DNA-binding MltR family transcriptional regulator